MPAYSAADIEMLLSVCRRNLGTADIPEAYGLMRVPGAAC